MCEYHFTKNSPTSYPTGRLLAKVDLGLAAYGITFSGGLLVLFGLNREALTSYAAENPEQKDIVHFISLPVSEQLRALGLYLLWNIYELLLAILFFFGTKFLSVNAIKCWIFVTIANCLLGLGTVAYLYSSIYNKPMFLVIIMSIYLYKLYCIYMIDMFLKEIIGRTWAAAFAAL